MSLLTAFVNSPGGGLVNVNGASYKKYARIKAVQTKQYGLPL